jgi:hypothetical protein
VIRHIDLFRIRSPSELSILRLDSALRDVLLIEWAERLAGARPPHSLDIRFEEVQGDENARTVQLSSDNHDWQQNMVRREFLLGFHRMEDEAPPLPLGADYDTHSPSLRDRRAAAVQRRKLREHATAAAAEANGNTY